MRFSIEQVFEAPLEAVEAAFYDQSFLAALGELPKLGRPELIDQQIEGDQVRQRVRYVFSGSLSSAVTAVLDPSKLSWIEEATIDLATHHSDYQIVPDHYANRLRCSFSTDLRSIGDRTTRVATGEVKVSFPLVGGRVERAIVAGLEEHASLESEVFLRWFSESG